MKNAYNEAGSSGLLGARELRLAVEEFNTEYCALLDEQKELEKWPEFFTDDALYVVLSQENSDAGMPAGIIYAEGRKMMRDRAVAIAKTQMFSPHHTLHVTSNTRIIGPVDPDDFASQSNFLLFRTLLDEKTKLHLAGYFDDRFTLTGDGLLLKQRRVVYQTMEIDRDLVYPV
jgi:3-phenylpropionate/cinnamic acid dioxygenase small subunit